MSRVPWLPWLLSLCSPGEAEPALNTPELSLALPLGRAEPHLGRAEPALSHRCQQAWDGEGMAKGEGTLGLLFGGKEWHSPSAQSVSV